jgi:hypothetical protein
MATWRRVAEQNAREIATTAARDREAQNTNRALFDEDPDSNSFDFYVGVASAIGLLIILIVAVVTAVSLWLLIRR